MSRCVAATIRCLAVGFAFLVQEAGALRPAEDISEIHEAVVDSGTGDMDAMKPRKYVAKNENSSASFRSEGGSVVLKAVADSVPVDQTSVRLLEVMRAVVFVVLMIGVWRLLAAADAISNVVTLAQVNAFLSKAGCSILITEAYELTLDTGHAPVFSGALLGASAFGTALFSLILTVTSIDSYQQFRHVAIATQFAAACGFFLFAIGANPPAFSSLGNQPNIRFWMCFLARLIFHSGGSVSLRILMWKVAPSSNTASIGSQFALWNALGVCLGPAISSLVNKIAVAQSVRDRSANPQYFMAICYVTFSVLCWWKLPRSLEDCSRREDAVDNPNEPDEDNALHVEDTNAMQHAMALPEHIRKGVFIFGLIFGFQRIFCVSCVETCVAFVLESQYGWSPYDTGMSIGFVFFAGLVAFVLDAYTKSQDWTSEVKKTKRSTLFSLILSLGIFSAVGRHELLGSIGPAWTLLFAAGLLFSASHVQSGIVDSLCASVAYPNTLYSMKYYVLVKNILQNAVARSLAPALARYVASVYGQDAYAALQFALVGLGLVLTYSVLPDSISEHVDLAVEPGCG